ncbi:type II secretion system protein [bacterium]|nr:type II secretion system protein [candidate division CSSED10-310 bacterium]
MARIFNKDGFTLLELMISMTILATALMGILPFFFYSQAQIKQATISNIAMSLVQEKMERISQMDFGDVHYMDAPYYPDLTTQYSYILPEVNMSPCTDVAPNPCGFQTWCNCLIDIIQKQGYFFTRTIDIDDPTMFDSMEFPADLRPGSPTGLNVPDFETKGVTIEVRWRTPGGERFVRSSTLVFDNTDLSF